MPLTSPTIYWITSWKDC
jgi:predicted alpha/beta-fold hydrolase